MPLQPFATATQMKNRTRGAITSSSHLFLSDELKAASKLIRNHCRWHVAAQETLRLRKSRRWAEDVCLPAMEIESLSTVTIDGVEWTPEQIAGIRFDRDSGWTSLHAASVDIAFLAGYETVPEDLVSLTLQVAARALGSPLGLVREQAGTVSVTHSQSGFNIAGGVVLLDPEKDGLTEYRLGWVP